MNVNLITALNAFAAAGDIAVVGDVISNLHPMPKVIKHADAFIPALDEATRGSLRPDLLITIGQSVISKKSEAVLAIAEADPLAC